MRQRMARWRWWLVALAMVLAAIGAIGSGTAHADVWQENEYAQILANAGVYVGDARQAANPGRGMCGEIQRGDPIGRVFSDVQRVTGIADPKQMQTVVWNANFIFCPNAFVNY
jgi:hypothetical protein